MSRSLVKIPFFLNAISHKKKLYKNRSECIIPSDINQTYLIHSGKEYVSFTPNIYMIGRKFGEFVSTKTRSIHPQ